MAGAIISIGCNSKVPQAKLLASKRFENFSSASAVDYAAGRLYVVGDDAAYLMVLDTALRELERVRYWPYATDRISKDAKPDLEATTILSHGDQTFLYAFGSMSTPARQALFQFPLDSLVGFTKSPFLPKTSQHIREWNIEGATMVADQLVLANRANSTNRDNFLVLYTFAPASNGTNTEAKVVKLSLPAEKSVKGVSGLFYQSDGDRLFFTSSEEETGNAIDDGAIGESYLGWIDDFSGKMFRNNVSPDGLLKLSTVDRAFGGQKIESVCLLPNSGDGLVLLLAADNDNGQSQLFKIALGL